MINFSNKRNLHITLPRASYVKVKVATFERQLTLQDAISGFAAMVASGDDKAVAILDELALLKYNGTLKAKLEGGPLSDVDRALLYDVLESDDRS